MGPAVINQLINAGLVETMVDIYKLNYQQLVTLERFGPKSAKNLLNAIEKNKQRP